MKRYPQGYQVLQALLNVPKSEYISEHEYQTARNDFLKTRYDDMKDRMKRLKADGYYLLHNHPSGNPKASEADVYSTKVLWITLKDLRSRYY